MILHVPDTAGRCCGKPRASGDDPFAAFFLGGIWE